MMTSDQTTVGKRKALIIGVSNYDYLDNLDFCKNDGNEMYNFLKEGLEFEIRDEFKLTGNRVEHFSIHDKIISFFTDPIINSNDTLLFYYSGHGIPDIDFNLYLASSETDPDRPMLRSFPFDKLTDLVNQNTSKRIVAILDCCHSGELKLGRGSEEDIVRLGANAINRRSQTLKQGEGKCILASSLGPQRAYDLKEKGHGIFTYYLLEGLKGNSDAVDKHGNVTVFSLGNYVYNAIVNLPEAKRPKQKPLTKVEGGGDIILANYSVKTLNSVIKEHQVTEPRQMHLLRLLEDGKIEEFNRTRKEDVPLLFRRLDFSGKDLHGIDLHEADLTETKFIRAKLPIANLKGARLIGADLSETDLKGADLYGANLSGANLTGANLRGADLKGMIDFSGANLTGANLRGADLSGMVNFAGAILQDVDFSGCCTDQGLINIEGARIGNVRGLPIKAQRFTVLYQPNEYLEALKSFSEEVKEQFTIRNLPVEKVKPIEESMGELTKELEDIRDQPEKIEQLKRKNINKRFIELIKVVMKSLSTTPDGLSIFRPLYGFSKLIGVDVQHKIEAIQNETYVSNETFEKKSLIPNEEQNESSIIQSMPAAILSRDKLLHKHVRCNDRRDIGYIAGVSGDTITVLGGGSKVYRIPKSYLVSFYGGDLMISLSFNEWKDIRYTFLV
jgi:uncharacterized protein YjbI with pentapeptide repeats